MKYFGESGIIVSLVFNSTVGIVNRTAKVSSAQYKYILNIYSSW
jgi:hypothetical protein